MSKKKQKNQRSQKRLDDLDDHSTPDWPTAVKLRYADGRVQGVRNGVWLYKRVPLGPMSEARTEEEALAVGNGMARAFNELAATSQYTIKRRSTSRASYREFHVLLINLRRYYSPPAASLIRDQLREWFGQEIVQDRLLLFGVKLRDEVGGEDRTWRDVVDSAAMSLMTAEVPITDYDRDFHEVDDMLSRSGFETPSSRDFELAESWWAAGESPEAPTANHADHIHVFRTVAGANIAAEAGIGDCKAWPKRIDGHNIIRMASVHGFDLNFVSNTNPITQWASSLLRKRAVAVSVRGKIEPSPITRAELRRQRKRYIEDIRDRRQQGQMSDQEQEEMLAGLTSVEGAYAGGQAPPTLVETSVVAAFSGPGTENLETLGNGTAFKVSPMSFRQQYALPETWIASPVRSNPNLMDLPSTTLSYASFQDLAIVGDGVGAQIGFTYKDRQAAFMSSTKSADEDSTPLAICVGSPGSGKLVKLSTILPTPTGYTTMGQVSVGDWVLGRDGKPVQVSWKSPINETPDLYRITFSNGVTEVADFDHQWVVSSDRDRHGHKDVKRQNAIAEWERSHEIAAELDAFAATLPEGRFEDIETIRAEIRENVPDAPWTTARGYLSAALRMMDLEPVTEDRWIERSNTSEMTTKTDPVWLYPVAELLQAALVSWENTSPGNRARWGKQIDARVAATRSILDSGAAPEVATEREIVDLLVEHGAEHRLYKGVLAKVARTHGIERVRGTASVTIPRAAGRTVPVQVWDAKRSVIALAERIRQQNAVKPSGEVAERRMTTGEMLGEGLILSDGSRNFSVRLPEPLDLPEADLPVAPYTLGAWLGDGTSSEPSVVSMDDEIVEAITGDGYPVRRVVNTRGRANAYFFDGLRPDLRAAGFAVKSGVLDKRVPVEYLRASYAQRLALLQGLMDTDGTVTAQGTCELALSHEPLAETAVELIRSLGIKASVTVNASSYTKIDEETGEKVVVPCKDRHRIKFATTKPVFRLARKLEKLLTELRETSQWLYIESIEPVASEPGACITVDSEDRTYLVGKGLVPTSNTQLMAFSAHQYAMEGRPVVVIDPKPGSDLRDSFVDPSVFSLDELIGDGSGTSGGSGVLDPLRFSVTPSDGINTAVSMLNFVNVWTRNATQNFEADLKYALAYGVQNGKKSIGTALQKALEDGVATPELAEPILKQSRTDPLFGTLVGLTDEGDTLRATEGLTYIRVGNAGLKLPAQGVEQSSAGLIERTSAAIVRMMVFGSAEALRGRRGVLMLDEAWVFLGAGAQEVDELGRLARSLEILPWLFTQKVREIVDAKIESYISRGVILHTRDPKEAEAAFKIFNVDPTVERRRFTTAMDQSGRKPITRTLPDGSREVVRGSIGLYCDMDEKAVDIEIKIPQAFLDKSSTNALDRARRENRQVI